MNNYFYAIQVPPEHQSYGFLKEDFEEMGISIIDTGSHHSTHIINNNFPGQDPKHLEDSIYSLRIDILNRFEDSSFDNFETAVNECFPKETGEKYSKKELKLLEKILEPQEGFMEAGFNKKLYSSSTDEMINIAAQLLSIQTESEYFIKYLRGCCQGDEVAALIPTKFESSEFIKELLCDAVWNTGNEYKVVSSKVPLSKTQIDESIGEGDCGYFYTPGYKAEEYLSRNLGCDNSDKLTIFSFNSWKKTPTYSITQQPENISPSFPELGIEPKNIEVTPANFKQIYKDLLQTEQFSGNPLKTAQFCLSLVPKDNITDMTEWLKKQGCVDKKTTKKVLIKWMKEKEIMPTHKKDSTRER